MSAHILVVDDDDGIRRLVAAVLKRHGYEIDEAHDGQEAIDRLDAESYDAVFLDLMMPVCNGYEVLDHLDHRAPGRQCVIVMTAAGTRGTRQLNGAPVHTVLHKPFDIQDILAAAEACVRHAG